MWLQVLRRTPTGPLTRFVSTTARPESRRPPSTHALLLRRVFRISRYYGRKTNDPIFKTFNYFIRSPQGMVPKHMLGRCGITVHEFVFWKPVIRASNWDELTDHLAKRGVIIPAPDSPQVQDTSDHSQPPTWVILYTLCYKVKRESDVSQALALTYHHLPGVSPHLRPALLILCACWLAEHDLLIPLQRVVDALLDGQYGIEVQDFHIQLLLQLIAYASTSSHVSPILRRIIDRSGPHALNRDTYDVLLRSPFATPQLGLAVSHKMTSQGYIPMLRHLTQLMLIYSRRGWKYRALGVLRKVRLHMANAKGVGASVDNSLHRAGDGVPILRSAESRFLASFSLLKTAGAWASSVMAASRDRSLGWKDLRQVYSRAINACPSLRANAPLHIAVIQGFLRRRDYVNALKLWETMGDYQPRLTRQFFTVGIEALTLAGRPLRALDLLFDGTELLAAPKIRGRRQVPMIDSHVINIFMSSLYRAGFTDTVFVLWEHMETLFNVRPDIYTFTILLKAARVASKCNPSFRGALAELGLSHFIAKESGSDMPTRESCFSRVEMCITAEASKGSSGLWKGERAGLVALRIAREIIFSNWPELKHVSSPAEALRPTGDFQGSFPMTTLLRTVLQRKTPATPSPDPKGANLKCTVTHPYPHIILSDILFRAYIDLLASESQIPQIPLALAWIRALGIKPQKDTLATALVYWAEVGMDAPLFEHLRDGSSQYARLQRWMRGWVGEAHMPTDEVIWRHVRRRKLFKEKFRRAFLDPES
ncbi:hypothetical protein DAEQUDRAFT_712523 [Daedalea quercina L-15889]|uniref:Pentacotripeptide-repeat region of PRORP domain-containing protein n=1 Tax=Daedalea quercina L-15889 TaxID=1314783 RepID=A0A165PDW9_9APHY|nr:hypothetical protein DAEQUDRAFT_712523 [Daedalea quercina L-15889]